MKDFFNFRTCHRIAADMLGVSHVDRINEDLLAKLSRVDDMVKECNPIGCLHSTQVIAYIVEEWKKNNPEEVLVLNF